MKGNCFEVTKQWHSIMSVCVCVCTELGVPGEEEVSTSATANRQWPLLISVRFSGLE